MNWFFLIRRLGCFLVQDHDSSWWINRAISAPLDFFLFSGIPSIHMEWFFCHFSLHYFFGKICWWYTNAVNQLCLWNNGQSYGQLVYCWGILQHQCNECESCSEIKGMHRIFTCCNIQTLWIKGDGTETMFMCLEQNNSHWNKITSSNNELLT